MKKISRVMFWIPIVLLIPAAIFFVKQSEQDRTEIEQAMAAQQDADSERFHQVEMAVRQATERTSPRAQRERTEASKKPPVDKPKSWKLVREFSGSGIGETESFDIASNEWKLSWSRTQGDLKLPFSVTISHSTKGAVAIIASSVQSEKSGSSFVHRAGQFHLEVQSVDPWKIVIEEPR